MAKQQPIRIDGDNIVSSVLRLPGSRRWLHMIAGAIFVYCCDIYGIDWKTAAMVAGLDGAWIVGDAIRKT